MDTPPPRLEDVEPDLAELLRQIANNEHPTIKGVYTSSAGVHIVRKPIRVEAKIGRNEPCPCGSGKKFKKCCAA